MYMYLVQLYHDHCVGDSRWLAIAGFINMTTIIWNIENKFKHSLGKFFIINYIIDGETTDNTSKEEMIIPPPPLYVTTI